MNIPDNTPMHILQPGDTYERFLQPLGCRIMSTVKQEDDEAEWLRTRTRGIGGSDIGPICNVSPFTSPRQLYLTKTGQYPDGLAKDEGRQERMHFGHKLEPIVASEYIERHNKDKPEEEHLYAFDINVTLAHKDYPWALANVDRLLVNVHGDVVGVLECKTTSEYMNDEWNEGEVLLTYLYQLQWYLFVTGIPFGAIACIVGGNKFYSYEIFRDDNLINTVLLPAAKHFWFENVAKLIEPEMQAVDTEFANEIYSMVIKGSEKTFTDESADAIVAEFVRYREAEKEAKELKEAAQNKIKDLLKETEIGYTANYVVKWSGQSQRRVNTDLLKSTFPEVYEAVLKTITFRRMMVKGT